MAHLFDQKQGHILKRNMTAHNRRIRKMRGRRRIIGLDFDHCCFDTDWFFHGEVRELFAQFEVTDELWHETYQTVFPNGYTLERHMTELERRCPFILPTQEITPIIRETFTDLSKFLFHDVIPTLQYLRDFFSARIILFSFGNPAWQAYKVHASGINELLDEKNFTKEQNMKFHLLQELTSGDDEIYMIDNNPRELDAIKRMMPQVQTFCINRVPENLDTGEAPWKFHDAKRYLNIEPQSKHKPIKTFFE